MTTAQAFAKFLDDIEPTPYQSGTLIPARKTFVIDKLKESFPSTSDMPYLTGNLMGSAAKDTIIRPVDDIDVLVTFNNVNGAFNKYRTNSQDFLYRIRNHFNSHSPQQVGARGQAVRIFFQQGGHLDIAPTFWYSGDDYYLPSGNGGWITTAPFKANNWLNARNQAMGYHLKPVVRLLKAWNRQHSSHFNSFHLETLAAATFTSMGSNYRDALQKFFGWAKTGLSVADPGGHSTDISSYMTYNRRRDAMTALGTAHAKATNAMAAEALGNHTEAIRLWRIILGDDFGK